MKFSLVSEEKTRNNFVSHLYSALKDRGIRIYLDETNLQKGQTISMELVKAIEESSIAIVVLSTNYASSTWCLNELVKIIECKNKSGLHVFPIFYDVDPSDVRKQKNSFSAAFSIHEVNFKDDPETVRIWREALTEVANLTGEDIRGRNEASCIKEIADAMLRQLNVKASKFRKSLVGIEFRISEIKTLMCSKPNEVLFIGLWGMGGIGKTTTARAIFEDCKNEFEGSCFLQDVKQNKDKMENLQRVLLSNVLKTKFEDIPDVVGGSCMIQERLSFKKVLFVIDDVDDIEQLNALAKECDWFGGGSRIIITTRDKQLLNDDHIDKYDVETLPENEALQLFCVHAFKNDHPPEDYEELSLQVLKYADGLPLALEVLGEHLRQREKSVWKSTLSRLKDVPEDKIISKLQISFDGLNVLQQNIFLDIACFFRGHDEFEVKHILENLGLHPGEGIHVLVQKSLITTAFGRIEMHDLLQEMGWHIVRQRANGDVRRYTRLWLNKDILTALSDIKVSSEAERIRMDAFIYPSDDVPISYLLGWEGGLRNMNKLSYLQLKRDAFKGNYNVNVSESFGELQLCPNLRWFDWFEYPGQSLPKCFHPVNLVHLEMTFSRIKETPDFSHMPNLEVLHLNHSIELVHVHASLGVHRRIKTINLGFCSKIEEFPRIVDMISLEYLNLSCTSLRCFPEMTGNVDCLMGLHLDQTNITILHWSIERATSLEILSIEDCKCLLSLPISFIGLQFFEHINVSSGTLLCFKENIDESGFPKEVELHFCGWERVRNWLDSQYYYDWDGDVQICFEDCKSLKELPEPLVSLQLILVIIECPILSKWICLKLVDILDEYKCLHYLEIHQVTPDLQSFLEWESMSNMLRKRKEFFEVSYPGRHIPSWLQYQFSSRSVTVFLPPLSKWYTDKFRGFVLSGINADIVYMLSTPDFVRGCCCPEQLHVVVMYVPINDRIREQIRDWSEGKECTIFELKSLPYLDMEMFETKNIWGLSLIYSEGEVNEVDLRNEVKYGDCPDFSPSTFKVKIARQRGFAELCMDDFQRKRGFTQSCMDDYQCKRGFAELRMDDYQCNDDYDNHIKSELLLQQPYYQVGTSSIEQDKFAPQLLPLFPRGPDHKCYQKGEPSNTSVTAKANEASELDLRLSLR